MLLFPAAIRILCTYTPITLDLEYAAAQSSSVKERCDSQEKKVITLTPCKCLYTHVPRVRPALTQVYRDMGSIPLHLRATQAPGSRDAGLWWIRAYACTL